MALELLSDFPGPAQLAGEQSTRLQHNSQFFDTVVNLFPPSVYLTKPEDSDDENQGNSRFFKNKKAAGAKSQRKVDTKQARRARFEEAARKSLTEQQKDQVKESKAARKADIQALGRSAASLPVQPSSAADAEGAAGTVDELRSRLRLRIEEARAKRNAGAGAGSGEKGKGKRKRDERPGKNAKKQKAADGSTAASGFMDFGDKPADEKPKSSTSERKKLLPAVGTAIDYGVISVGSGPRKGKEKPKKKDLAVLLEKAERNKKRLAQLEAKGDKAAVTEAAWGKAMQHAQGEKVLDDPKLLSKAIKRKEKGKQKSAQAWAKRKETEVSARNAKQEKRKANLDKRTQKKQERVLKKKGLGAGFDGRKQGFLNK